ncbi:unnamed protein product [Adineta ricciae]|uniref:Uncharacterized protein n=1 Tax=Adineta ricciae TaxID=249248 RepID=A0A815FJL2_ADIRI|nr:unnamed protein product [Adineta ricciae]
MTHIGLCICAMFVHLTVATPQINLYSTDSVSGIEANNKITAKHNCLRVLATIDNKEFYYQMISYCMDELSEKVHVINDDSSSKFSFVDLAKQNITSDQLYLWSAPIDTVENYQLYLNQLYKSTTLGEETFYNCTLPRFGPMCQYEFYDFNSNYSSLHEIIYDIYKRYLFPTDSVTCYEHLQCNRGPRPMCLDWTEICNRQVDCIDSEIDEEHCWQLEMNQCKDTEFQCPNGQCVPRIFVQDNINVVECLDEFDSYYDVFRQKRCMLHEPSFDCEDIRCQQNALTSDCRSRQSNVLKSIFSVQDNSVSDSCWNALKCKIDFELLNYTYCSRFCLLDDCIEIINVECPKLVFFPAVPVLFSHIYFAFIKNHSQDFRYPYICYNNSRYDRYFQKAFKIHINNTVCYFRNDTFPIWNFASSWTDRYFSPYYRDLWEYDYIGRNHLFLNYSLPQCNVSDMYQCENSIRCISVKYVQDKAYGCPNGDDENESYNNSIILKEESLGIQRTYSYELKTELRYIRQHISFQTICDGFQELAPIDIDGQNQTDETQCEQWQCDNIYTRCDGLWNCLNGDDEIGCNSTFQQMNCSSDQHVCVSPHTNQLICISTVQANDGKEDCLGGIDEPALCRGMYHIDTIKEFHCWNESAGDCLESRSLCEGYPNCAYGDDEKFCQNLKPNIQYYKLCKPDKLTIHSDAEKFLCSRLHDKKKPALVFFSLDPIGSVAMTATPSDQEILVGPPNEYKPQCHRGFDVHVWSNNRSQCLCPSSYYGNLCQYQNQRVSLSLKFRALSDSWQTPFEIVILLIDDSDEQTIHSHEKLTYLSVRDCQMKFHLYLLYSTRPKNATRNYSIQIDIYEKISLHYRGSVHFPIDFPFLPVHRLAFHIEIPKHDQQLSTCSNLACQHGKCVKYLNNQQFCRCDFGWSGKYCQISHICTCNSLNSICIGTSAHNQSICVCDVNKFGPRCLINTVCQTTEKTSMCQHQGQCVPTDDYMMLDRKFRCICKQGFSGERCETEDSQLVLSFAENIMLTKSILIHFIEIIKNNTPVRATTSKIIHSQRGSISIRWSQPFHIVFIEFFPEKLYYLALVQSNYRQSAMLTRTINSSSYCPHVSEIFNKSFSQWHLLRRIKSYHLACQSQRSCFYDDVHFCLCYDYNDKRLANCFEFDYQMKFDCAGESVCENEGRCFQELQGCPRHSTCICPSCFYGYRCQFSARGFGLSLDAIIGYHIRPDVSILQQSTSVQLTLILIIMFTIIGFIDGILSLITFQSKAVREVGCGLYLLCSSITTLLLISVLGCKFFILYLAQVNSISNRSFLQIQCITLDFVLRICLNMDQWLAACVACERAMTVIQGVRFIKHKSTQIAKTMIILLLIFNIGTTIHDPIHRRLIDEEDNESGEKRIWCTTTYPSSLQTFDHFMNTCNFFVPFVINFVSVTILIIKKSYLQASTQTRKHFLHLFREQIHQHQHLLIAPIALIVLALPRLIISYVSQCMESINDMWVFLVGYFISLIPPMLTFVIFVLPSKFYKKQFNKSLTRYRTILQRRLYFRSSE